MYKGLMGIILIGMLALLVVGTPARKDGYPAAPERRTVYEMTQEKKFDMPLITTPLIGLLVSVSLGAVRKAI